MKRIAGKVIGKLSPKEFIDTIINYLCVRTEVNFSTCQNFHAYAGLFSHVHK